METEFIYTMSVNTGQHSISLHFCIGKMTNEDCDIVILHLKGHPFPILMYCVHYEKVKDLCRKHIMAKKGVEYLQFITHPADEKSYHEWYRRHVIDED